MTREQHDRILRRINAEIDREQRIDFVTFLAYTLLALATCAFWWGAIEGLRWVCTR